MEGFSCVAAIGSFGQLGENNDLPWPPGSIKGDMNFFKTLTLSNYSFEGEEIKFSSSSSLTNAVIMGRKTWDSIPCKFKPLNGRLNIIITSSKFESDSPDVIICSSFEDALSKAQSYILNTKGQIYVIGGASIYSTAIKHPNCRAIFLTEISGPMKEGDVFFPLKDLYKSYSRQIINDFALPLIKESVKNLHFDGEYFVEKDFKYQFCLYK